MKPDDDELGDDLKLAVEALKGAPPTALPRHFAAQVAARAAAPVSSVGERLRAWLSGWLEPRTVRMRPVVQLGLAFLLCVMAGGASLWLVRGAERQPQVLVRFSVAAPRAHSVSVAGDFNSWDPEAIHLQDPTGDGRWQALVPMRPGVYQYMFVIDDERWIPDPTSTETVDDGFGQRNSVVRIDDVQIEVTEPGAGGYL